MWFHMLGSAQAILAVEGFGVRIGLRLRDSKEMSPWLVASNISVCQCRLHCSPFLDLVPRKAGVLSVCIEREKRSRLQILKTLLRV